MLKTFRDVLNLWPSRADLARDIGQPYNTVVGWWRRGNIPAESWLAVIGAAKQRGFAGVTPEALTEIAAASAIEAAGSSSVAA